MIDVYASLTNYVDHLAPIWAALPAGVQGRFLVSSGSVGRYARARWGLPVVRERPSGPTLVASYTDERLCPGAVALLEHGAGQHYGGLDATSARSTERPCVGLYLAPNQVVADRMAAVLPCADRVVVGCPRLDAFTPGALDGPLALAWHWNPGGPWPESRSAWPHYKDHLHRLVSGGRVWGHGHPRIYPALAVFYSQAGVRPVADSGEVLSGAGVISVDNSSLLYEAVFLDRPVVVLDAPWYRRDVDHGLRFWEWADVGPRISDPRAWPEAVAAARHPSWASVRARAAAAIYGPRDRQATIRAVAALSEWAHNFDPGT